VNVTTGQYVLWLSCVLLQLGVVALMLQRKSVRAFPVFFAYNIYQVFFSLVQFAALQSSYAVYFYVYWINGALSVVVELAVIHEIFGHLFQPFGALRNMASVVFRWAVLVLVLVGAVMAATQPASNAAIQFAIILTMERSLRILQCGLVMLVLLFSTRLGLSWLNHVFGITLGFGCFAAMELVAG